MKLNRITVSSFLSLALLCAIPVMASCSGNSKARTESDTASESQGRKGDRVGGPQLGKPGGGPVIDKSNDSTLQAMIKDVLPEFKQSEFTDAETGKTMKYNLFSPKNMEKGKKYPLVLFIADASTPGDNVTRPLTQGYGGLVWATDNWQKDHPCYVLVPQFSGVAVNDAYEHTDEVDIVIRMLLKIASENNIDNRRLYTTGQSMGGMISMYYNVAYPDLFAASIFVDSHWDTATFPELAKHKFVYFIAGDKGKAFTDIKPLETAAEKDDVKYAFAEWNAKLPEKEQNKLASDLFAKGAPVNMIQFSPGSVLPADGKGSEHMYSFDYAYKIQSVKEWLFKQTK